MRQGIAPCFGIPGDLVAAADFFLILDAATERRFPVRLQRSATIQKNHNFKRFKITS